MLEAANVGAHDTTASRRSLRLALGALGVVFGDIGTSPLYAMRECLNLAHGVATSPENVFGIVSLVFWALKVARVPLQRRVHIEELKNGFRRVIARYGFMETPDVPTLLERPELKEYSIDYVTFFLGRETVLPTKHRGMALWRERLFAFLTRNAQPATAFFGIPPSRVMEIGAQIEI